jgi:hypothetical protein
MISELTREKMISELKSLDIPHSIDTIGILLARGSAIIDAQDLLGILTDETKLKTLIFKLKNKAFI